MPAEVRRRASLGQDVRLLFVETPGGLVLMTQAQARDVLRGQLGGSDVVAQLLADRRVAGAAEDGTETVLLEASAALAFVAGDHGADVGEQELTAGTAGTEAD